MPKSTVLIVDDEPTVQKMTSRLLRKHGYDVLLASDGFEALTVFEEHRDAIDVVLLDMTMPRMDGPTTYDELIKIAPNVRVLFSSGYDHAGVRQSSNVDFIHKPYSSNELVARLRGLM